MAHKPSLIYNNMCEKQTNDFIHRTGESNWRPFWLLTISGTCNFYALGTWYGKIASLTLVGSDDSFTRIPFAKTTLKMKALALTITAVHWQRWTTHWSGSTLGEQVQVVAEIQMVTLAYSGTDGSVHHGQLRRQFKTFLTNTIYCFQWN